MGLRTWIGIKKKREPRTFLGRYPDVSPKAALTAHILPEHPAFTDYIHRRINGREPNAPRMNKPAMAAFASRLGFRVSKIFAEVSNAVDLDLTIFPERFVVKPSELCSTKGVMLLQRKGDHSFFDMMQRRELTPASIRREQSAFQKSTRKLKRGSQPKIIVEEMVVDELGPELIPLDYKFYTFNGDVKFIVQVDRNTTPPSIALYRNEFEPVAVGSEIIKPALRRALPGQHRRPSCWREQLELAKTISKALKTPFISVDTYASADGPVVGELTPTPGGSYFGMWRFRAEFDRYLGDVWTEAARALSAAPDINWQTDISIDPPRSNAA